MSAAEPAAGAAPPGTAAPCSSSPGASREEPVVLGRGRSAVVRLVGGDDGPEVEKVFIGDWISNALARLFFGAPLPYRWSEAAVDAAIERRAILQYLLPLWFGPDLRMTRPLGRHWDEQAQALTLRTELVRGVLPQLRNPCRPDGEGERRLREEIMPRLVEHLLDSGFFGLVWQAGLGNPKAHDNFMVEADGRLVWLDGESGVPAMCATSPAAWRRVYLPAIRRLGRPSMDDVDIGRLRAYLAALRPEIDAAHGAGAAAVILSHIDRLERAQAAWLGMSRRERRAASRAVIAPRPHPGPASRHLRRRAGLAALRLARAVDPRRHWSAVRRFVGSQAYRTALGTSYVRRRLRHWRARGQLSREDTRALEARLREQREAGRYLTDFGAHLGMKATFFALEVVVLGTLALIGVPLYVIGLAFVFDGPLYRTAYTLYRSVQNALSGGPILWTALGVGVIPFFGTLAFPAQMLWSAAGRRDPVAAFVVYDSFSRLAAAVPLVGGENSALEHRLNRVAHKLAG